jgi:hypothetical protein
MSNIHFYEAFPNSALHQLIAWNGLWVGFSWPMPAAGGGLELTEGAVGVPAEADGGWAKGLCLCVHGHQLFIPQTTDGQVNDRLGSAVHLGKVYHDWG